MFRSGGPVGSGVIDLRFRIDAEDRDGLIVYTLDFADAVKIVSDQPVVGAPVPPAGSPMSLGTVGVEGDPRRASPSLGKMFLEWKVRNAVAEIRKLVGGATK